MNIIQSRSWRNVKLKSHCIPRCFFILQYVPSVKFHYFQHFVKSNVLGVIVIQCSSRFSVYYHSTKLSGTCKSQTIGGTSQWLSIDGSQVKFGCFTWRGSWPCLSTQQLKQLQRLYQPIYLYVQLIPSVQNHDFTSEAICSNHSTKPKCVSLISVNTKHTATLL